MVAITVDPATWSSARQLAHLQRIWADDLGLTNWALASSPSYSFPGLGTYSFCLPDLALDAQGRWRATEFNVSNAAGTSAHESDFPRANHEVETLIARGVPVPEGAVVLRPISPDTRAKAEIHSRAAILADGLETATAMAVTTTTASADRLSDSGVSVVVDGIPAIAAHLRLTATGDLMFRDRSVCFMNNPNLLAQLARREGRALDDLLEQLDGRIIHEGTTMARLGFDKVRQQSLCADTGIEPVEAMRTPSVEAAVEVAREFAARFGGSVVKPNAASGAAGVVVVDPSDSPEAIERAVAGAAGALETKYGKGWEATCPFAVYEFIHAQPAVAPGGPRRWDLRFEVLVRPESVTVTPLSARTCPAAISDRITHASAVTNQTGRAPGEAGLISPAELCRQVGLDGQLLAEAANGVYEWVRAALGEKTGNSR